MKLLLPLLLLFINLSMMNAQDLSQYQWKNRILVIQFDELDQENYKEQIRIFKTHKKGLTERKLIVYQICGDLYKKGLDERTDWDKADRQFLKRFDREESKDLEVFLIGLDGGIKMRQSEVLTAEDLFGTIDVMPMRKREMRKNEKGN